MIVDMRQLTSNFSKTYAFFHQNYELYQGMLAIRNHKQAIVLRKNQEILSVLVPNRKMTTGIKASERKTQYYDVLDCNQQPIGSIYRRKTSYMGYFYYHMCYGDRIFTIYEVGLGKDGIDLSVYQDNQIVAMIHKPAKVINNLDRYTLYTDEKICPIWLLLLSLYYDRVRFYNHSQVVSKKQMTTLIYTRNQSVLRWYQPKFKENCQV